jgi:hypothetical protein
MALTPVINGQEFLRNFVTLFYQLVIDFHDTVIHAAKRYDLYQRVGKCKT